MLPSDHILDVPQPIVANLQKRLYTPDAIHFLRDQFASVARQVSCDPGLREEENRLFEEEDPIGKIWFRMFRESTAMESHKMLMMIPDNTIKGYQQVVASVAGFWYEVYPTPLKSLQFLIDRTPSLKTIVKSSEQFRALAHRLLSEDESLDPRMLIGSLMTELQSTIREMPDPDRKEYEIGASQGWDRWRALSTQG